MGRSCAYLLEPARGPYLGYMHTTRTENARRAAAGENSVGRRLRVWETTGMCGHGTRDKTFTGTAEQFSDELDDYVHDGKNWHSTGTATYFE
eukprot:gene26505-33093_t